MHKFFAEISFERKILSKYLFFPSLLLFQAKENMSTSIMESLVMDMDTKVIMNTDMSTMANTTTTIITKESLIISRTIMETLVMVTVMMHMESTGTIITATMITRTATLVITTINTNPVDIINMDTSM